MRSVLALVPCRRFKVGVQLGSQEGLGHIEQFVLRAILAGADSLPALRDLLRLEERVVLDACMDLLRSGYLTIDRESGRMAVTPVVSAVMGSPTDPEHGWAQRLSSSRPPDAQEFDLLQDLVSGSVFPIPRAPFGARGTFLAPEDDQIPGVIEIPKATLLHAVVGTVRKRTANDSNEERVRATNRLRVLDVTLTGGGTVPPGEVTTTRMAITIEVIARGVWTEEEAPPLAVIGPPELPASVRRAIAHGLAELWRRGIARGAGQFFALLRERLEALPAVENEAAPSFETPYELSDEFTATTNSLPALRPGEGRDWAAVHRQVASRYAEIRERVEDWASRDARVEIVQGAAAHHDLLLKALASAQHQVVLVNPWVKRLSSDRTLRDALRDAVHRGIRIHLVWGMDRRHTYSEQFDAVAREFVAGLGASELRRGGLFLCEQASGVHAKVIVCDLSWALVSSCNFLNSGPERSALEVGLKISAPATEASKEGAVHGDERRSAARAVQETLLWARGLMPDFRVRRTLSIDPTLEGLRERVRTLPVNIEPHAPEDFPYSVKIWSDEWQRRAAGIAGFISESEALVQPIRDGEHRQLLDVALSAAKRRLIVASDKLGTGVLGEATVRLLHDARQRGVDVTLVYADDSGVVGDTALRRNELATAGVRMLRRDSHAKALVCDDWAVVASFNFLSFEGYYSDERIARREFGVRVVSTAISEEVAALLTVRT